MFVWWRERHANRADNSWISKYETVLTATFRFLAGFDDDEKAAATQSDSNKQYLFLCMI